MKRAKTQNDELFAEHSRQLVFGQESIECVFNRFRRFVRRAFLAAAALFSALLKDP